MRNVPLKGFMKKSPMKGVWDSKKTSSVAPKKTDTSKYMADQEKKGYGQTKFSKKAVAAIVPKTAGQALGMVGGAGVVKAAKALGRGYNTLKAAKNIKASTN